MISKTCICTICIYIFTCTCIHEYVCVCVCVYLNIYQYKCINYGVQIQVKILCVIFQVQPIENYEVFNWQLSYEKTSYSTLGLKHSWCADLYKEVQSCIQASPGQHSLDQLFHSQTSNEALHCSGDSAQATFLGKP